MSEQKKYDKIEDAITNFLDGELQKKRTEIRILFE